MNLDFFIVYLFSVFFSVRDFSSSNKCFVCCIYFLVFKVGDNKVFLNKGLFIVFMFI